MKCPKIPNKIITDGFIDCFVSTTKELLEHPFFEGPPEETHHYPNCEICSKTPDENKPNEKWFVGYNWGEWFSIFICEDCIREINYVINNRMRLLLLDKIDNHEELE
jgi:hypothetical protein